MLKTYQYTITKNNLFSAKIFILEIKPTNLTDKLPDFIPGQWVFLGLYDKNNDLAIQRPFSIASSPQKITLQFAIKLHRKFTAKIKTLKPGQTIGVRGPFGQFVFEEKKMKQVVLLAGGIGIAPFMSILRYATDQQLKTEFTLFYSAKTRDLMIYQKELKALARTNPKLNLHFTLTREQPPRWQSDFGRIDKIMIKKHCRSLKNKYFFLCGSTTFVANLENELKSMKIPLEKIKREKFY